MKVSKEVAGYEARLADVIRTAREVLRRRIWTLLAIAAAITALGVVLTLRIDPVYQGEVRLQIDPSRNPLSRSANEAQAQLASEAIETEVSVINSLDLARTVVTQLGLAKDPEFTHALQARQQEKTLSESEKLDIVGTTVLSHLNVSREKLTYIIGIRFTSLDATKAARIANAFATAYLDTRVGSKIGTAERQLAWFQKRLDELAAEARAADEKVAQYQSQAGIVKGANQQNTIIDQQIGPVAIQMANAQAAAAAAKAQLASAQAQVRAGRLDAVSDVLVSPTISDLRRQRGEVAGALGEIENRYGPKHPESVRVRDQLAQIDRQLRDEADRIMRSLRGKADAAQAQAAAMTAAMGTLEDKQANNVRASVIAASLQRDADSKHEAYDRMAKLAFDTRQASQNSLAQAQIIDAAEPPQGPSWPNRPLLFFLSLLVGVGAGIAVITIQELMVSGMRTVEELEADLGITVLGAVPAIRKHPRPADLLIEKPTSQFAEALRNVRASITGVKADASPKVIALTSALPSEGKTTTALSLARSMAIHGSRTIIVDVDIRRAQLRTLVSHTGDGPGTVEVLRREATLPEAIEKTELEMLDQLVVKKPYFSSENLFGTDRINEVIEELSGKYDVVIFDLPPLLGLADGRFLAALADAVVLIVKWDSTPAHAVSSALTSLRNDGSNVIGAVYTMVDSSSESVGAYYYYSKQYSAYYTKAD